MIITRSLAALALCAGLTAVPAHAQYSVTIVPAPPGVGVNAARALGAWTGAQAGVVRSGTSEGFAALWQGSADSFSNLHPAGYERSAAVACSATTQGGYGTLDTFGGVTHALLWRGSAATVIDLHPATATHESSRVTGLWGGTQCGFIRGTGDATDHACLWQGTAASFVDLHPPGVFSSMALGAGPGVQAGVVTTADFDEHAFAWTGTPASGVDLHPAGFSSSRAFGTDGAFIVGEGAGVFDGRFETHALIWTGSPDSVVDLHPPGYDSSAAYGAGGQDGQRVQVGSFAGPATGFEDHAAAWSGTPASLTDLHAFLPIEFIDSRAFAAAPDGTIVGEAFSTAAGPVAVIWTPLTHPCSADFNHDGDVGTDQDIEAFFACIGGHCCPACGVADFNADGDVGTDQDIEAFFRVLGGGAC